MSSHNAPGHGIADIYRSVINDVIAQVKESFLDESIDIDVLNQLKKDWEEKIVQSGCVDMDPKPQPPANSMRAVNAAAGIPHQVVHRPQPQPVAATHQHLQQQHLQIQPTTQQLLAQQQRAVQQQQIEAQQQLAQQQAQAAAARQQQQLLQAQLQQHQVQQQFQAVHALPVQMSMNSMPYMQTPRVVPMQQYTGLIQGGLMPQNIMVVSGGQTFNLGALPPQQRMLVQQQLQQQQAQVQVQQDHVHQLDGGGELRDDVPCSSASLKERKTKKVKKAAKPTRKEAEKVARQLGILQLDGKGGGGGGGMSDSSSEEEEEEEDDPLRRIADRIGDDGENLEEDGVNEDPLNSDDDQSDDEDLSTLFDAEDVVMCQFEKVSRARAKWKFVLKDGIMHVGNKDFCFQKCTGEADW